MIKKFIIGLVLGVFTLNIFAADTLAIAQPVSKGGVDSSDVEAFWSILEANVGGNYKLISRSALNQIMTEIGLTTSSDLVNLNSTQKAKLGEIETVKYLLIPTISKFGTKLNVSLILMNSSTGVIDPNKRISETVNSIDELSDKIKYMLNQIDLGKEVKKLGRSAILAPIIKVPTSPKYLSENFYAELENSLLDAGINLQNLQSIDKILSKNNIGNLGEIEPAMYIRIGELLQVDTLLQTTINRFSYEIKKEYIKASKRNIIRVIGNIGGNIRIISAQTGNIIGSIVFNEKVDFDDLDTDLTEDWTSEDYGIYMIENLVPKISKKVVSKIK